ncbi:MAG: HEAT repeat domain-containing protein [Polyangiaceae bacterium]
MLVPLLPRTLEASLRDLTSKKLETRASAASDLARAVTGDTANRPRAIIALEKALEDEAPAVRAAAAVALADLKAAEALPKLLVTIEDVDATVRQMAIVALGEIRDARALPRLQRALEDSRAEVRFQAVIAYARIAEPADAATAIVKATHDSDENVRYIALRSAEDRIASVTIAEKVADRAEDLLADPSSHVAIAAAIVLAKAGRSGGKKLISSVVLGTVKVQKEDEREAVEISGELGLSELQKELERRAWGIGGKVRDTCAFHAKIALARMGSTRAIAEITGDLRSPKREMRDGAVVSAGRAKLKNLRPQIEAFGDKDVDPDLRRVALEEIDS